MIPHSAQTMFGIVAGVTKGITTTVAGTRCNLITAFNTNHHINESMVLTFTCSMVGYVIIFAKPFIALIAIPCSCTCDVKARQREKGRQEEWRGKKIQDRNKNQKHIRFKMVRISFDQVLF